MKSASRRQPLTGHHQQLDPGSRRRLSPNSIVQACARMYERAGIVGASSHSGRRWFMTEPARNGVHARIIQQRAGHAFAILAACLEAARAAGWTAAPITAFLDRSRAGDEDQLRRVVMPELDVLRSESGAASESSGPAR